MPHLPGLADLPLRVRKCVAACLFGHEGLWDVRLTAYGQGERRLHDALARRLNDAAALAMDDDPDDTSETLTDFLRHIPDAVGLRLPAKRAGTVDMAVSAIRAHIEDYIQDGRDPLQGVWAAALEASLTLYRAAGVPCDGERLRCRVVWEETHVTPHLLPIEIWVGGFTRPAGARTRVELILTPRRLTAECRQTIPYILFHELIAHALGARPAGSELHDSEPFTEGWMDLVALQTHDAAVRGARGAWPLPHAADTRQAAWTYHRARFQPFGSGKTYSNRLTCRSAAERVESVLKQRLDHEAARATLWRLSAALNRTAITPPALYLELCTRLVSRIDEHGGAIGGDLPSRVWLGIERLEQRTQPEGRVEAAERFLYDILDG